MRFVRRKCSRAGRAAPDVIVDRRGVIYMSEANSGIYNLSHQGHSGGKHVNTNRHRPHVRVVIRHYNRRCLCALKPLSSVGSH
jgi:hypothetical protein